jgi:hypothetical protein
MTEDRLIPAGNYKAVAIQTDGAYAQIGMSTNGNQEVLINFEIIDGPMAGRRIPWWGFLTDKAWNRTVEALRYCGFKGDDLYLLPSQQLDQEVELVVEHSEYQGKTNARVRWVNAAFSGLKLAKPMDTNELRNFSAMMRDKIAQVKPHDGKKAEKGAASAPRGDEPTLPTDEELPF